MKPTTHTRAAMACLACSTIFGVTADADSRSVTRLVAQETFTANEAFIPPEITGRRFWLMLPGGKLSLRSDTTPLPGLGALDHYAAATEIMVREAARSYRALDLSSSSKPLVVDGARLLDVTNLVTHVPFMLGVKGANDKTYLDDFTCSNQKAYRRWKAQYPNFLGFYAGNEIDCVYVSYLRGQRDQTAARLRKIGTSEAAVTRIMEIIDDAAQGKDQAAIGLRRLFFDGARRFFFADPSRLVYLHSAWGVDHYMGSWGTGMIIMETTSTGPYRHQQAMASARGAARQFATPWTWYMAVCYNGCSEDGGRDNNAFPYCLMTGTGPVTNDPPGHVRGPFCGMSPSLLRRDLFMGYFSGASFMYPETYPEAYWQYKDLNTKSFELSPFGQALKEVMAFSRECPDRGVSYAPVALLLPWNHASASWGGSSLFHFPMTRADTMIDAFHYTILPHAQNVQQGLEGCLANSEFGDIFDVLRPDPPNEPLSQAVLKNYPVAVLLGAFDLNRALAQRLMQYVKQGGTLVINTRQLNSHVPDTFIGARLTGTRCALEGRVATADGQTSAELPEPYDYDQVELRSAVPLWLDQGGKTVACVNTYGRGRVVLTTVADMVPRKALQEPGTRTEIVNVLAGGKEFPLIKLLMRQVVREVLPVEVRGDIQYGLNRVADGWWVYLINNKGVTKFTRTPQKLDPAATAKVMIAWGKRKVTGVRELVEKRDVDWDITRGTVSIDVGPGDVRVVKLTMAP